MRIGAGLLAALLLIAPALPLAAAELAARPGTVVVYAATDRRVAQPLIDDFQARNPDLRVDYREMESLELYQRFLAEAGHGDHADVVWSSAMDLQVKLVNDGYARAHHSAETAALPAWANWKNEAYGTSCEPIVVAYNRSLLPAEDVPTTHAELLRLLATAPAVLQRRLATYDPVVSGLGYLLHSQDNQANPVVFWGIVQDMGGIGLRTFGSTAEMLNELSAGHAVLAYNVLGSYALTRAAADPALGVSLLRDYTLVMSRVAFIARRAPHPEAAGRWLDYLLSRRGQALLSQNAGLYAVRDDVPGGADTTALRHLLGSAYRPIQIGPALLTYQDQQKRSAFLAKWQALLHP